MDQNLYQISLLSVNKIILILIIMVNNHLISHVGNRLGIVDRWIQTFPSKMEKYMTEHDTNLYIYIY